MQKKQLNEIELKGSVCEKWKGLRRKISALIATNLVASIRSKPLVQKKLASRTITIQKDVTDVT